MHLMATSSSVLTFLARKTIPKDPSLSGDNVRYRLYQARIKVNKISMICLVTVRWVQEDNILIQEVSLTDPISDAGHLIVI